MIAFTQENCAVNDIESLNRRFAMASVARFEAGGGGLTRLVVHSAAADADLYLHGAHVTAYTPVGEKPVLFMSAKSLFSPTKAIRGGVPICFPWFGPKPGDPKAAAHGFARLMEWTVDSLAQTADGIAVTLALQSDDATRAQWPADFTACYTVTFGPVLKLALAVTNNGSAAFQYQGAFHTYLNVGDVRQISVTGLEGTIYLDKMNKSARTPQGSDAIHFTGETDRVYLATQSECIIHDPVLGRQIHIAKTGSDSTVVWNPWIKKTQGMSDLGQDEWPKLVCVETCNVGEHAVNLAPAATHVMTATVFTTKS